MPTHRQHVAAAARAAYIRGQVLLGETADAAAYIWDSTSDNDKQPFLCGWTKAQLIEIADTTIEHWILDPLPATQSPFPRAQEEVR